MTPGTNECKSSRFHMTSVLVLLASPVGNKEKTNWIIATAPSSTTTNLAYLCKSICPVVDALVRSGTCRMNRLRIPRMTLMLSSQFLTVALS